MNKKVILIKTKDGTILYQKDESILREEVKE